MNPQEPTQATNAKDPILEAIEGLKAEVNQKFSEYDEKLSSQLSTVTEEVKAAQQPEPEQPKSQWQPQSWDDFVTLAREVGEAQARQVLAERDAQQQKQQEEFTIKQQQVDQNIQQQLVQLEKDGLLPKVGTEGNVDDQGVVARRELLAYAVDLGTPELTKVAKSLKAAHDAGLSFDPGTNQFIRSNPEMPGKYAPVGSSSNRSAATTQSGPTYELIHKAPNLDALIEYANRQYGA